MSGYAMAETQSTCGERLMDHDQNGTANLIDGHQHRRATDDRSRVIKVAAKRLTNVEVEEFTIIVILVIDRNEENVCCTNVGVGGISNNNCADVVLWNNGDLDADLVNRNGIDVWAATIVDQESLSRRRGQYCY